MADSGDIYTYIILTASEEYYCGKTKNLRRRFEEHKKEHYPKWFMNENRKVFITIWTIEGDYEKEIKSFGIKRFIEVTKRLKQL